MSYEPTNWKDGDLVTSAKLNKIEQGIAASSSGILIATEDYDTHSLNKTWQEFYDSSFSIVLYNNDLPGYPSRQKGVVCNIDADTEENEYTLWVIDFDVSDNGYPSATRYITDSENGYPTRAQGGPGGLDLDPDNGGTVM